MSGALDDEALYKLVMHLLRFPQTERVSEWVCTFLHLYIVLVSMGGHEGAL